MNAAIIPGKSAAGIELGSALNEFNQLFAGAKRWNRECQIQEAIGETSSWLHVPARKIGMPDRIENDYYYSHGAVRLGFDMNGALVLIVLAEGYKGRLFDGVGIGDRLDKILSYADLAYDDVDELHHVSINHQEIGLSIYAEEMPLHSSPDQKISRIFVHSDFL